jgi:Ca2+-binding RTX toxin-like protein
MALGRADGSFGSWTAAAWNSGWGSAGQYRLVDVDGDARAELVFAGEDGSLKAAFFKADGTVERTVSATVRKGGALSLGEQAYADINGDGVADSVWRSTGNTLMVALGSMTARGQVSFGAWQALAGSAAPAGFDFDDTVMLEDINGDRKDDLIWVKAGLGGAPTGRVVVMRNTSSATVAGVSGTSTGGSAAGMSDSADGEVSLLDVNGDGRVDLVRTTGGKAAVRLGQADGSLAAAVELKTLTLSAPALGGNLDLSAVTQTLAALNGDARDQILVGTAWSDALNGAAGRDTLRGGAGSDTLDGGDGEDLLEGGDGADTLSGGSGNDTLVGGAGADTYLFGLGGGKDVIRENDATPGVKDVLQLGGSISASQLWFRKVNAGADLEIGILGTTDAVVVQGWYSNAAGARIEEIRTASGETLLQSQVDNLVNAMAAFAAPPVGQTELTREQKTGLIPTMWSSWQRFEPPPGP